MKDDMVTCEACGRTVPKSETMRAIDLTLASMPGKYVCLDATKCQRTISRRKTA